MPLQCRSSAEGGRGRTFWGQNELFSYWAPFHLKELPHIFAVKGAINTAVMSTVDRGVDTLFGRPRRPPTL